MFIQVTTCLILPSSSQIQIRFRRVLWIILGIGGINLSIRRQMIENEAIEMGPIRIIPIKLEREQEVPLLEIDNITIPWWSMLIQVKDILEVLIILTILDQLPISKLQEHPRMLPPSFLIWSFIILLWTLTRLEGL